MVDAQIVVGIKGETAGGKRVKRTLDDIARSGKKVVRGQKTLETQIKKTDKAGKFLANTMKSLGVAFGLRQLQQVVDVYTNMQNRLKLVTDSSAELVGVTEELFKISNETRLSFEATAEIFVRTALATKELGLSQRDTLDFTKSLNQAIILSGASAREANAGMIQLSQGLASGTLRGDELRSVMEQLPAVASIIAKGMGVTRGELRKMGEQGKISADIVIDAFKQAREELNEKFAKTVPTISQSFVVLRNRLIELIGELDKTSGASGRVSKILLALGKNIDKIVKGLIGAATLFVVFKGLLLLTAAATITVGGATTVLIALFAGPLGLVALLGAAAVATAVFSDELTSSLKVAIDETIIGIDKLTDKIGEFMVRTGAFIFGVDQSEIDKLIRQQENQRKLDTANRRRRTAEEIADLLEPSGAKGTISTEGGVRTAPVAISKEVLNAQKELQKLIKTTATEQETLINRIKELGALREFATTEDEIRAIDRALEAVNAQLETATDILPGLEDRFKSLNDSIDDFAENTADAFGDFISGAKSGREALSDLIGELQKFVLRQAVIKPLAGILSNVLGAVAGSFFGGGGSTIAKPSPKPTLSGRGFAHGGSLVIGGNGGVDQNQLSLNGAPIARVGRGETLSISPSQKGPSIVVNQTLNISTGVAETVAAEFATLLPQIQESTRTAINEAQQRGIT